MTQGDPLATVAYGTGVLLLIKQLESAYTDVTQPWYADNAVALGRYNNIELYFNLPKQFAPGRRYYPNPQKAL